MANHLSRHLWPGPKTRNAMNPQNVGDQPTGREKTLEAEIRLAIDGREKVLDDGYHEPGKHDKPRCRRRKPGAQHYHRGNGRH